MQSCRFFFYMTGKCLPKSQRLYKTDGHSHKNINSLLMDFHFTVEGWSLAFGPSPWRFIGVRSDHIWMIWKWVLSYELMLASLDRKLHSKTHRSLSIHQKVTLKWDHTRAHAHTHTFWDFGVHLLSNIKQQEVPKADWNCISLTNVSLVFNTLNMLHFIINPNSCSLRSWKINLAVCVCVCHSRIKQINFIKKQLRLLNPAQTLDFNSMLMLPVSQIIRHWHTHVYQWPCGDTVTTCRFLISTWQK